MSPVKIYVGNIPSSARNSELKELFEKFGKVLECDILKDFGFVHMNDTNDAKAAIAGLNDILWKGSRIRVEISTTKTNKGEPSERKLRAYESRRSYPDRYSTRGGSRERVSSRDYPYPPPHYSPRRSSRERNGRYSIRESRYESSNDRYRDRGYSDLYDHRNSYGPASSYRSRSSSLDRRDFRSSRIRNEDPYHGSMHRGSRRYSPAPPPPPPPPHIISSRFERDRDRGRDREPAYRPASPPPPSSSSSRRRYW